jgi:integrase
MPRKALTALQVATISKPGFYHDAGTVGLYLQVAPSKSGSLSRSWAYRYNSPLTGSLRWLGLGSTELVSLAEARKLAYDYRKRVRLERRDPVQEKRDVRAEAVKAAASAMTFEECCKAFLAQHAPGWANDKHRHQWRATLATACAAFGKIAVDQVETPHIVKCLMPIWERTPETGSRLRGRIERVLDWATAGELRQGPNPARWSGHIEFLLKRRPRAEHHEALPWRELPAFMALLRSRESLSARALEFTILTAARTGETIGATWDEFDLDARVWTIPAGRMKAKVEHKVPLSDRAVAILNTLPRDGDRVFQISNMAMLEVVRGTSHKGCTVHGFRSTFRDWAGESTGFPREIIEFALAHKLPDRVEAAYRRESGVEKRRKLLQAWASYCQAAPAEANNVRALRS